MSLSNPQLPGLSGPASERQRWLIVIEMVSESTEVEQTYRLWVHQLDTDNAVPELVYNLDDLLAVLLRGWNGNY